MAKEEADPPDHDDTGGDLYKEQQQGIYTERRISQPKSGQAGWLGVNQGRITRLSGCRCVEVQGEGQYIKQREEYRPQSEEGEKVWVCSGLPVPQQGKGIHD